MCACARALTAFSARRMACGRHNSASELARASTAAMGSGASAGRNRSKTIHLDIRGKEVAVSVIILLIACAAAS